NLPVEYFNPVRNLAVGKGVDAAVVQREGHMMGELVGLGLRGIGKSEINIDLVPAVVEQTRAADRRTPLLIAAAAVLLGGTAAWAALQNVAAAKAADSARTMADQRDTLAPVKTQIDGLLKREAALRNIAGAYVSLEADHAFWMDLINELRHAFASDAVWITDFEPLTDYNPLQQDGPKNQPKAGQGKSLVKADFATAKYGNSSLAVPQGDEPALANAIRIKGFWRENPRSQNVVSELLKNLREKSTSFRFTAEPPPPANGRPGRQGQKGEPVTLSDEQILDITVSGEPGELGLPFEITLPLARKVAAR
ncbi:MAG TPA: hypothetical protein VLO11_10935, partial [Luteolibacter sp.]|nr:hypothetical protein [Luteolibacter sp.]